MIGKYMAAARGPKNAAAKGGANTKSLRSGTGASGSGSAARSSTIPKGSMAGFEGGKSAYIETRGSGYGRNTSPSSMPKAQTPDRPGSADIRRGGGPRVDVTDLRRVKPMKSPTDR